MIRALFLVLFALPSCLCHNGENDSNVQTVEVSEGYRVALSCPSYEKSQWWNMPNDERASTRSGRKFRKCKELTRRRLKRRYCGDGKLHIHTVNKTYSGLYTCYGRNGQKPRQYNVTLVDSIKVKPNATLLCASRSQCKFWWKKGKKYLVKDDYQHSGITEVHTYQSAIQFQSVLFVKVGTKLGEIYVCTRKCDNFESDIAFEITNDVEFEIPLTDEGHEEVTSFQKNPEAAGDLPKKSLSHGPQSKPEFGKRQNLGVEVHEKQKNTLDKYEPVVTVIRDEGTLESAREESRQGGARGDRSDQSRLEHLAKSFGDKQIDTAQNRVAMKGFTRDSPDHFSKHGSEWDYPRAIEDHNAITARYEEGQEEGSVERKSEERSSRTNLEPKIWSLYSTTETVKLSHNGNEKPGIVEYPEEQKKFQSQYPIKETYDLSDFGSENRKIVPNPEEPKELQNFQSQYPIKKTYDLSDFGSENRKIVANTEEPRELQESETQYPIKETYDLSH